MISLLSGILLLCVLVIVHEGGHFFVAKALGVRVLTFSVGFGPKLLKWTYKGTEYCLSAIPLGGYVKMLGESPTEELSEEERKVSFLYQALWKKSAIALAGPLCNIVLPIFLFFFVFVGSEQVVLPVVGTTIAGEPAALAGIKPHDRILSVDGVKVDNFGDVIREVSQKPEQNIVLGIERGEGASAQRLNIKVHTASSPDPNPVNIGEKVGRLGVMPAIAQAKIAVLDPGSAAAKAGLRTFDEVISIDGVKIDSFEDLEQALNAKRQPFAVEVLRGDDEKDKKTLSFTVVPAPASARIITIDPAIRRFSIDEQEAQSPAYLKTVEDTRQKLQNFFVQSKAPLGVYFEDGVAARVSPDSAAAKVGLKRGDRIAFVNGVPVESGYQMQRLLGEKPDAMQILGVVSEGKGRIVALRLQTPSEKGSAFDGPSRKVLGLQIGDVFKAGAMADRKVGVVEAFQRGIQSTGDLIKLTFKSLVLLFSFAVPVSQIGGPIMIFDVAGQAASQGLEYYIFVMSLVSVNLGLLNLLPIPVLDGGHLMMFFIEFVTRRPLSLRARQIATQVGLAFVMLLMLIAIFNDVVRLAG